MHEHSYTHTHIRTQTHTHTYTHAHKDTHARERALAGTHAHKMFFRDRKPEFVEPLAGHCQGGWIQFFKKRLKKRSYLVNISTYRCFRNL